jgi:TolB protein
MRLLAYSTVVAIGLTAVLFGLLVERGPAARGSSGPRPAVVVPTASGLRLVDTAGGGLIDIPGSRPGDGAPALSPDGRRVALSRKGEIVVIDLWTPSVRRLTMNPHRLDTSPAWSPDGKRIAWSSGRRGMSDLFLMDADGGRKRALVTGAGNDVDPSWSPDGDRLVFATDVGGDYGLMTVHVSGGEPAPLLDRPADERRPVWSPRGNRIAYSGTRDDRTDVFLTTPAGAAPQRLTRNAAYDGRPVWSPDGLRLGFVTNRTGHPTVWSVNLDGTHARPLVDSTIRLADGIAWGLTVGGPPRLPDELLPDLDQRAPSGLLVLRRGSRVLLGFASAVDNVGDGPVRIRGSRSRVSPTMRADQLVELTGGGVRAYRDVGVLRYTPHPPHYHWHFQPFERYELRRAGDFALLARDRKSGFCLADHYGHAADRVGRRLPPRFLGDCGKGHPTLLRVDEGSSVGYTDRYPAFFHGQDVDVTGLSPGFYVLVHRANPERRVHELRYDNNAASVLVRLDRGTGEDALSTVTVLRTCQASERCDDAR